jgi:hypothetical protein
MTFNTELKTTNSKPPAPLTTTMTTPTTAAAGAGIITMKTVTDTFPNDTVIIWLREHKFAGVEKKMKWNSRPIPSGPWSNWIASSVKYEDETVLNWVHCCADFYHYSYPVECYMSLAR